MEKRIAALLNSSKAGNIFDKDSDGIREVIHDYFTNIDGVKDQWSDSEDDDETDEPDVKTCELNFATGDVGLGEEADGPVVDIAGAAECEDMDCNGVVPAEIITRVRQFSCNCKQIKVVPEQGDQRSGCIVQFPPEEIVAVNLSIQDMDRDAKDQLILGLIAACMRNGAMTECSRRKEQAERQKSRSSYSYLGRSVCTKTFLKLLTISPNKLKALTDHFKEHGLAPRKLKSGGRKSNTASLSHADNERVKKFIVQYAEDNAVSLPGRVPGFKRDDIQLLPSAHPKSRVYRAYAESVDRAGYRKVAASTFRKRWMELCPYIVVAKPMTDLCWRCQNMNSKLFHGAGLTHEEKQELVLELQQHLSQCDAERQLYRDMVQASKATVAQHGIHRLEITAPNSKDWEMHYSFDFAQQVHYPSNAAQPGPMYFLTARKCAIFGVCCEGLPQQINYLIDESVNTSKGSNGVISYLHHFFENHGLGEKVVHLHCDNCSGQNKNRYVLWYFAWRVLRKLHSEVTINFMPPGHTKFAPDWCFGLLKRCFRRSEVSCLDNLCEVVKQSTPTSNVNMPQLVGKEDGSVDVPTYNWQEFFNPAFRTLVGIKSISHFRFYAQSPGRVFYKASLAEDEKSMDLITRQAFEGLPDMPQILPAPGLPRERQEYLYRQIREFVRYDKQDVVCPRP